MGVVWGVRAGQILVRLVPAATAYWLSHGGSGIFSRTDDPAPPTTIVKATMSFRRWSSATVEDDLAQFSMHHLNITDGNVDNSWTPADITNLHARYIALANGLRAEQDNFTVISKMTYHEFVAGDPPGPAVQTFDMGALSGTKSGGALPPQCACSVTLKTAHRRHWGRVYVPGLTTDSIDGWGRMKPADADILATVFGNHVADCSSNDFPVVIYSEAAMSAMEVGQVQVDDVVDIIRRRRFKTTNYYARV